MHSGCTVRPPKLAFLSLAHYYNINKQLLVCLYCLNLAIISHLIIFVCTYCNYLPQVIIIRYTYRVSKKLAIIRRTQYPISEYTDLICSMLAHNYLLTFCNTPFLNTLT